MGSVLRASGCFAADHIFYTGTRYDRAVPFYTDTANHRSDIPLTHTESLLATAKHSFSRVSVELCEGATALPEFQHPHRALYLFGPEDDSLSQSVIDASDHVIYIPTHGCLNLSASVNIVLYDRYLKRNIALSQSNANVLIRQSRDCRNNLRVKSS